MAIRRIVFLLLLASVPLFAPQRYSTVASADTIITGKIRWTSRYPWFGGWRLNGEITVAGSLYSTAKPPPIIPHRFLCSCCPMWPPPNSGWMQEEQGIWFLKKSGPSWTSAGECYEPGFRPIAELGEVRAWLLQRNR
ncbi:MAG: hypothetical protein FJW20_16740 [Acidimicrobiia bacterium]|nr:hypothetical protein [Acidimicrobiia bacterium]